MTTSITDQPTSPSVDAETLQQWAQRWHNTCETIMTMLGLSSAGSPEEMLKEVQDYLATLSAPRVA